MNEEQKQEAVDTTPASESAGAANLAPETPSTEGGNAPAEEPAEENKPAEESAPEAPAGGIAAGAMAEPSINTEVKASDGVSTPGIDSKPDPEPAKSWAGNHTIGEK